MSQAEPQKIEGFEIPKILGGKRQQKQQGGSHLAFSELKGGKRSRKQQQKQQEGGALTYSELKGGRRSKKQDGGNLAFAEVKGGNCSSDAGYQPGGTVAPSGPVTGGIAYKGGKKRRSAKKSHRRRSSKRTTMKSMVKGLFGVFKKK